MLYLGVPATVAYEAAGFLSGLRGVYAYVRKPSGQFVGPFSLEEGPMHALGRYFFDFMTTKDDLEGRYMVMMTSPQENDRQSTVALDFMARPFDGVDVTVDGDTVVNLTQVEGLQVEVTVMDGDDVTVVVGDGDPVEVDATEDDDVDIDNEDLSDSVVNEAGDVDVEVEVEGG